MVPHSGCHFLRFWRILVPQLSILGSPWRPAGHQMAPQIAQVSPKGSKKVSGALTFCGPGKRLASNITFGAFLGTILVDLGWILASFLIDLGFSAAAFAECQSRLPRNEITENVKNMQITSEICKHQTQEETNHQNSDREFASCKMQSAATNDHLQIRGRRCSRR